MRDTVRLNLYKEEELKGNVRSGFFTMVVLMTQVSVLLNE